MPIGHQALAEQRMRQPGRAEQQEQVHLGDAQLDMLAFGRELPFRRRGNFLADEGVGLFGAGKQLAPVDPGAQIGRAGDIRRGGDDALGQHAVALRQIIEDLAEAHLGRNFALAGRFDRRHRYCRLA